MTSAVLIANRGEIACRIIRTARRLGLRTIAVYSDADHGAMHVHEADEAYRIGSEQAVDSYLKVENILDVAREAGADFIHPGYGFLSENVAFARACSDAGVTFVGPPVAAIEAMGLKDAAKRLMQDAGVPVVPGYHGDDQSDAELAGQAEKVGYPLLIKAVAGGGGKGMRRVDAAGEFAAALESCRREARAAFGDDRVLIERFVDKPRHIEVQVFCDTHGNAVHLFERDCSLQRRHQKVIEEAPAPGMTDDARAAICAAAVKAAKAVGYVGAGTVEFIADGSKGLSQDGFFFMEMNTRLQVEHPVTEAITGVDLVEWQFRVARGEKLPLEQDGIASKGHAIEARVYAEDPANGFLPQTGRLHRLDWPERRHGMRIDTGVREGDTVAPYYDPMLAKVIVHGKDRTDAIAKLKDSLEQTTLLGMRTNLAFCRDLVSSPAFAEGLHDTLTIDQNIGALVASEPSVSALCIAVEAWLANERAQAGTWLGSPWEDLDGWALGGTARTSRIELKLNGTHAVVGLSWTADGKRYAITMPDRQVEALVKDIAVGDGEITGKVDGARVAARYMIAEQGAVVFVNVDNEHITVRGHDVLNRSAEFDARGAHVAAPMSGRIIAISAKAGESVTKGQPLAVLEAMKMEHPLVAGFDGTVDKVNARTGDQVEEGFVVVELAATAEDDD